MDKTIKLRVKKQIDTSNELKILKLKGTLITKGYTEIIHIAMRMKTFTSIHFPLPLIIKKRRKILYWIISPLMIFQTPLPFWGGFNRLGCFFKGYKTFFLIF